MISVIIPTYKPSALFEQTVESIARQTFRDFEVIIVLNGCCEPYLSRLEELTLSLGDKVRIIQTDTPGVSNARNIGIEEAQGDYLCFIDDDDLISEHYLEEMWRSRSDKGVVLSDVVMFDDKGEYRNNPFGNTYRAMKDVANPSLTAVRHLLNSPWGKLYPKSLIGTTRFSTRLRIGEDGTFNFVISSRIDRIAFASERAIYYYRENPAGVTARRMPFRQYIGQYLTQNKLIWGAWLSAPAKYNITFFTTRLLGLNKYILKYYILS